MKFLSDCVDSNNNINNNLTLFKGDPERSRGQRKRWDKVGRNNNVAEIGASTKLNNALVASKVFGNVMTPVASIIRSGTELGRFIHRITPKRTTTVEKWRMGINSAKQTQGVLFDRGMLDAINRIKPPPPRQATLTHNVYRHWAP